MGFKVFSIIFLFVFVTSIHRISVAARRISKPYLEWEGYQECPEKHNFTRSDADFKRYMLKEYTGMGLRKYKMNCEGNRTSDNTPGPGALLVKEVKGLLSRKFSEPERCTFKIQAPEDYHVYVFGFTYQFRPALAQCVNDSSQAILADVVKFYDGQVADNSLLYSALHNPHDFNITTTGRDLLVDIDQSDEPNVLNVDQSYHRYAFFYAFIKRENEKVVVYGDTKPCDCYQTSANR